MCVWKLRLDFCSRLFVAALRTTPTDTKRSWYTQQAHACLHIHTHAYFCMTSKLHHVSTDWTKTEREALDELPGSKHEWMAKLSEQKTTTTVPILHDRLSKLTEKFDADSYLRQPFSSEASSQSCTLLQTLDAGTHFLLAHLNWSASQVLVWVLVEPVSIDKCIWICRNKNKNKYIYVSVNTVCKNQWTDHHPNGTCQFQTTGANRKNGCRYL